MTAFRSERIRLLPAMGTRTSALERRRGIRARRQNLTAEVIVIDITAACQDRSTVGGQLGDSRRRITADDGDSALVPIAVARSPMGSGRRSRQADVAYRARSTPCAGLRWRSHGDKDGHSKSGGRLLGRQLGIVRQHDSYVLRS